ncbi:transposon protein, putative, Pong sub-class [Panicum miliaceum]|uniref:Transposon protein, putative, Pong sub-class n=1 Tax=Panicum miliaceum TaxID=4540 RepID=A0A3L6SNZ5_PANMI|nr:transposon protein, putative, Pong sub-class [Panicum miliaceum]
MPPSKRTSAPAPMEIPPASRTQSVPPPNRCPICSTDDHPFYSTLDSLARRLAMRIKAKILGGVSKRQYGPRKSIPRDHVGAHQRLVEDYFAAEPLYPERPCHDVVIAGGANGVPCSVATEMLIQNNLAAPFY